MRLKTLFIIVCCFIFLAFGVDARAAFPGCREFCGTKWRGKLVQPGLDVTTYVEIQFPDGDESASYRNTRVYYGLERPVGSGAKYLVKNTVYNATTHAISFELRGLYQYGLQGVLDGSGTSITGTFSVNGQQAGSFVLEGKSAAPIPGSPSPAVDEDRVLESFRRALDNAIAEKQKVDEEYLEFIQTEPGARVRELLQDLAGGNVSPQEKARVEAQIKDLKERRVVIKPGFHDLELWMDDPDEELKKAWEQFRDLGRRKKKAREDIEALEDNKLYRRI